MAPLATLSQLQQLYVLGNALRGALELPSSAFAGLEILDALFNALGPEVLVPLAALPRLKKADLAGNAALDHLPHGATLGWFPHP